MVHKYKVFIGLIFLSVLAVLAFQSETSNSKVNNSIAFSSGINDKIKKVFIEVWQHYESLHHYGFEVVQRRLSGSTMQAQPVIDFSQVFGTKRGYRIDVAEKVLDSGELHVADLPEDVLRGWFAHELGHMIDYENHSNVGMIAYGIRYSLSDEYKREREHEADSIAIRYGFK
uniref:hypothetical protein n=1 Tax=Algoriphagus sp. TaxID=1872435 RepID=UPI0025D22FA8